MSKYNAKQKNEHMKNIEARLTKGLLDLIILQLLDDHPMHGYEIITTIYKNFGVCLSSSAVYPILNRMEKESCVKSEWNRDSKKLRKIYSLTNNGQNTLNFTEEFMKLIFPKVAARANIEIDSKTFLL